MSWLRTASPIDDLIDKATSENLPAGTEDLAQNLEICDQIRSKQVSSKDAAKALKRRINHKNPNVQLLALGLTDACVKNGGQHFLFEVASRDFIDNMTSILKAPAGCNLEVKSKILMLLQTWGRLFRGKQGLGYVCDTYMILQHEGYEFPPADNVGAALVETAAPPDWTDSDVCTRCRTTFTLTNRKHHCRACGSTFCGQCSSKTMSLPNLGVNQEVRVCDGCWIKRKMGGKGTPVHDSSDLGSAAELISSVNKPSQATTVSTAARGVSTTSDDDDLKKAIELSLQEVNSSPGYKPSSTHKEPESTTTAVAAHTYREEDTDLLAAIEASLRETDLNGSSTVPHSDQGLSAYTAYTYSAAPETTAVSVHALTQTDRENIEMFSTLVDRIQAMNSDVAGNREVQALYEQISKLQYKVEQGLEEADKKQREAVLFSQQIDQAVKMYDHLLQERLNSTYQQRMSANSYTYPGAQQQHQQQPAGGYNITAPPHAHQNSHVYPHLTGADPNFSPSTSNASYPSFAPHAPSTQPGYQYPPSQSSATAPFASSPYASAPPPAQSVTSQVAYQSAQNLYYGSAPGQAGLESLPPGTQSATIGQFQGYPTVAARLQSAVVTSAGHAPYAPAPFAGQQQQQQEISTQAYAPAAPVVPVEEKPLIEL
ncbi:Vacuolar protein-sorting-associated protein 27 [Mortierella claussenii]|nr:Vacuolar protein-sorting-associated protein 27 [Mortierella claussenii]